jgi:glycogen debranching enzyme
MQARRQAQAWLSRLEFHVAEAGLGHVSEIFDGDAPHRPCGCIAQAWSVAEILRVYIEDVRGLRRDARSGGRPEQSKDHPSV